MRAWILHTDGGVEELDRGKDWTKEREFIRGVVGGDLEHVTVLYQDQIRDMFVNECGSGVHGHERLAPNARASLIYWTATCQGRTSAPFEPRTGPLIHGTAVLYEEVIWT